MHLATENEDALLYLYSARVERPIAARGRFDLHALSSDMCEEYFRFTSNEIVELIDALALPQTIITSDRHRVTIVDAVCIVLRRLSYPTRLSAIARQFHRTVSGISTISNHTISLLHRELCGTLQLSRGVLPVRAQQYAQAISARGAPLRNCVAFVDGTLRPICRPRRGQQAAYSAHRRIHAMKFQAVTAPDGIIVALHGPIEGRHHDMYLLSDSRVLLDWRACPALSTYVMYGDSGYTITDHLIVPHCDNMTADKSAFNAMMSSLRVCVEWSFSYVTQNWSMNGFRYSSRAYLSPIGTYYSLSVALANCLICMRGSSKTSLYFNCPPPTFEEYIQQLQQNALHNTTACSAKQAARVACREQARRATELLALQLPVFAPPAPIAFARS